MKVDKARKPFCLEFIRHIAQYDADHIGKVGTFSFVYSTAFHIYVIPNEALLMVAVLATPWSQVLAVVLRASIV